MKHFRLGSYIRLSLLREKFSGLENKKILDAGCNYGEITKALSEKNQVVGIDPDEKALKIARKFCKKAIFKKSSLTNLHFSKNTFDTVICLAVLEHIKDDKKAIKEIARVLKKEGELILAVPNKNAELIPTWLSTIIRLVNKILKTDFPTSEKEYLHFGQEGIGHVRQGYSLEKISKMLLKENLRITFSTSYWNLPARFIYILLMPFIKKGLLKEKPAKIISKPFFFLDKIFKDDKGDILIIARKESK